MIPAFRLHNMIRIESPFFSEAVSNWPGPQVHIPCLPLFFFLLHSVIKAFATLTHFSPIKSLKDLLSLILQTEGQQIRGSFLYFQCSIYYNSLILEQIIPVPPNSFFGFKFRQNVQVLAVCTFLGQHIYVFVQQNKHRCSIVLNRYTCISMLSRLY